MKFWKSCSNLLSVDYLIHFLPALVVFFDQFLLVMMRLRLNARVQDLGYRFNIHPSTVCRYFSKWLDVLYTKLPCFINWPERDILLKTIYAYGIPNSFQKMCSHRLFREVYARNVFIFQLVTIRENFSPEKLGKLNL